MSAALVDGDTVAFRAAVTSQEDIDWGDGEEGLTASPDEAIEKAFNIIRDWCKPTKTRHTIVCFSDPDGLNFRRTLGSYKGGRPEKPIVYWDVVEAIKEEFRTEEIPTLEADDVMGIMATSPKMKGSVIVSPDKDMRTIPAKVFDPLKDKKPKKISLQEADRFWRTQTLTGDRVDGYHGIRGIGPKKAEKILAEEDTWASVKIAYLKAYEGYPRLAEREFLMNARMARILRREDYDKEKGEIRLWHSIPKRAEWKAIDKIVEELRLAQESGT